MFKKKVIKTPQPEDYLKDAEVGLNVAPNALTEIYSECKKSGKFTSHDHHRFIKEGLNVLMAIAGDKQISMSQAKSDLMNGKMSFKDVEAAIGSLGAKGGMFEGMSDMVSGLKTGYESENDKSMDNEPT